MNTTRRWTQANRLEQSGALARTTFVLVLIAAACTRGSQSQSRSHPHIAKPLCVKSGCGGALSGAGGSGGRRSNHPSQRAMGGGEVQLEMSSAGPAWRAKAATNAQRPKRIENLPSGVAPTPSSSPPTVRMAAKATVNHQNQVDTEERSAVTTRAARAIPPRRDVMKLSKPRAPDSLWRFQDVSGACSAKSREATVSPACRMRRITTPLIAITGTTSS